MHTLRIIIVTSYGTPLVFEKFVRAFLRLRAHGKLGEWALDGVTSSLYLRLHTTGIHDADTKTMVDDHNPYASNAEILDSRRYYTRINEESAGTEVSRAPRHGRRAGGDQQEKQRDRKEQSPDSGE